jgi:hypothetical protein
MPITRCTDLQGAKSTEQADAVPMMTLTQSATGRHIELAGAVLEAQFCVDGGFLVFLTEDTPYEEALHIHLLDGGLTLRDSLELSAPYAAAVLANLAITPADEITFSFFDKTDCWRLTVLAQPAWLLWGSRPPVRRARPLLRKTWLKLHDGR